jgi:hypothetical protein
MTKRTKTSWVALLTAGLLIEGLWVAAIRAESESRIFEIRTYSVADERAPELAGLFRDNLAPLFVKHGMPGVAFFVPQDDKGTFIYILAHKTREGAKENWKNFLADPAVRQFIDYEHKIGLKNTKVVSVFATATDYSPLK